MKKFNWKAAILFGVCVGLGPLLLLFVETGDFSGLSETKTILTSAISGLIGGILWGFIQGMWGKKKM
jgi:hypothetical protein